MARTRADASNTYTPSPLLRRGRDRLLDPHVLAGRDRGHRQFEVALRWRYDSDAVERRVPQQIGRVGQHRGLGLLSQRPLAPHGVEIADGGDLEGTARAQVADDLCAPVAAAEHARADHATDAAVSRGTSRSISGGRRERECRSSVREVQRGEDRPHHRDRREAGLAANPDCVDADRREIQNERGRAQLGAVGCSDGTCLPDTSCE